MKQIKDYIHHYLGCDCFEIIGNRRMNKVLKVSTEIILYSNVGIGVYVLSLRPLSDMTEEEARKFLKLDGIDTTNVAITNYGILHDNNEWGFNPLGHGMPANPHQFMFLLSKGFDLFQLIPAGLAIDKTTLKEKI